MPQSLSQIYVHIVFSTKDRVPHLQDPVIRERTHAYIAGICRNRDCPAVVIGGAADHIHGLCRLSKNVAVKDLLQDMKRSSSVWVKTQAQALSLFQWQAGYGAFSVGFREADSITRYIQQQDHHHEGVSFQDEFRRIMKAYGIEWDERYVWA